MGDDAEYYMEQQTEEEHYAFSCQQAALEKNKKYLFCWINGIEQDLWWEWEPMSRVFGIFSNLYNSKKIGNEYFLSCSLPEQEYEYEDEEFETSVEVEKNYEVKLIGELEFGVVSNENDANNEVLLLSQKDIEPLKIEAIQQKNCAKNLKEQIISEMIEEMVSFMELNPENKLFIFARNI